MKKIIKLLFFVLILPVVFLGKIFTKKNKEKRILIVKVDNIGDYLLCRNFFSEIKKDTSFSGYKITLCGKIDYKQIAEFYDKEIFSDFIWVDFNKFFKNPLYGFSLFKKIAESGFEICIQPTLSRSWGDLFVLASEASKKIGAVSDLNNLNSLQRKLSDLFFTQMVDFNKKQLFELEWYKYFFGSFLKKDIQINLDKSFYSDEKTNSVCIFPGASSLDRCWNVENYKKIIDFVLNNTNFSVIILGGKKEIKQGVFLKNYFSSKERVINKVNKCNFLETVNFLKQAKFLFSNETFSAHLSVLCNTRFYCISSGSSFGRFHPYPQEISTLGKYFYPENFKRDLEKDNKKKLFGKKLGYNINDIKADEIIECLKIDLKK